MSDTPTKINKHISSHLSRGIQEISPIFLLYIHFSCVSLVNFLITPNSKYSQPFNCFWIFLMLILWHVHIKRNIMQRKNCWEVKKCGRQPGGENAEKCGVCPAAIPSEYDGTNKGTCSGRFCWFVAGTICEGKIQGSYAQKLMDCINCEFLIQVNEDEGSDFVLVPPNKTKSVREA